MTSPVNRKSTFGARPELARSRELNGPTRIAFACARTPSVKHRGESLGPRSASTSMINIRSDTDNHSVSHDVGTRVEHHDETPFIRYDINGFLLPAATVARHMVRGMAFTARFPTTCRCGGTPRKRKEPIPSCDGSQPRSVTQSESRTGSCSAAR
jgi:hypothetical protein